MTISDTTRLTLDATRVSRRSLLKCAAGALALAAVPLRMTVRAAAAATDIQPGDIIEVVDGPLNLL